MYIMLNKFYKIELILYTSSVSSYITQFSTAYQLHSYLITLRCSTYLITLRCSAIYLFCSWKFYITLRNCVFCCF